MTSIIIPNKADSGGDLFVKGCNEYIPERRRTQIVDHLEQLMKNYESVYGTVPTNEELKDAIKFTGLFLAEIAEVYGGTRTSHEACNISGLIDEDSLIETCTNLAGIPTDDWIEQKSIRDGKMIQEQRRKQRARDLDKFIASLK